MTIADALDEHQSRRNRGMGCVSLLVGPYAAAWSAVKGWAGSRQRLTANVSTLRLEVCLRALAGALLRTGDSRATVLATIFPRRAGEPSLDAQNWDALTPFERADLLAKWPADATTKTIAERILTGANAETLVLTLEELETATDLLGGSKAPVLVATTSEDGFRADELTCLLEVAERIPATPIIFLAENAGLGVIQEAANRGERVAAFVRDGIIPLNGISMLPALLEERLVDIPENIADRAHTLTGEGVPDSTIDTFLSAAMTDPKKEPNVFDSRAEEFLFLLLEGDPRTAGLFTPQGQPGFQMNNNQPAKVDFLSTSLRIALEVDGPHHLQLDQFRRDRRKDRELQKAGYLILRFLAEDVVTSFEEVRAQIQTAVAWRANCETGS